MFPVLQCVVMESCDWWVGLTRQRDEWSCASLEVTLHCVMTPGMNKTLVWPVDSSDTPPMVSSPLIYTLTSLVAYLNGHNE